MYVCVGGVNVSHSSGQLLVSEYFWMDEGVVVSETSIGLESGGYLCVSLCVRYLVSYLLQSTGQN